ncbi:MAG: PD40 domain-containing protein [Ardenticatenaceae bacterium]|nr:PD40 domain-containing protein [Ardenticatenaceae bacterium]
MRRFFLLIVLFISACAPVVTETAVPTLPTNSLPAAPEPLPGLVFTSERDGNWEIYRMDADGSNVVRLTDTDISEGGADWSPDGRSVVFWSRRDGNADVYVMGADGRDPRNIAYDPAENGFEEFYMRWHPDGGSIAFFSNRFGNEGYDCAVHRIGFMAINGGVESMQALSGAVGNQETLDWSPDGQTLAFSSKSCGGTGVNLQIFLWNIPDDAVTQLTKDKYINAGPAFSHDGRFLAYHSFRDGNSEIILLDLASGEAVNLTNNPAKESHPTWSPDDSQIAFVTDRDGNDEIYVMDVDGTNLQNLTNHPARDFEPRWSPIP